MPERRPPDARESETSLPPTRETSWRHRGALVAILLFAALLRVAFGWPSVNPHRAFDERFALENVEALLRNKAFTPVSGFHPSLSYLPQTAALGLVEACGCLRLGTSANRVLEPRPAWNLRKARRGPQGAPRVPWMTPLAYRSCRLLQALIGTLTVFLVYLLGRRLFSSRVGLGAALVTAGVPWLIWASGVCNEEAVFVLMFVVVAIATLRACERPTIARFAWLGVACGLALASKLNGVPACLPIVGWVAWRWRDWRRLVPRLLLAGVLAAGTFVALNPHFVTRSWLVKRDFSRTMRLYASKGQLQQSSKPSVLLSGALSALGRESLGPVAGAAALVGGLLVARRRRDGEVARDARVAVALGLPLSYLAAYALVTTNSSDHSWLPLVPFFAVLCAVTADSLWSYRPLPSATGPETRTAAARIAAILALCAPAVAGSLFTYRVVVPATVAVGKSLLDRTAGRYAFIGLELPDDRAFVGDSTPKRLLLVTPGAAGRFTNDERARLDGWIERAPRGAGAEKALDARSSKGEGAQRIEIVRPQLFSRRGPAARVVWRPWRRVDSRRLDLLTFDPQRGGGFRGPPAPAPGAPLATIRLWPALKWRERACWLSSSSRPMIGLYSRSRIWRRGGENSSFVESERYDAREAASLVLHCRLERKASPTFSSMVEIVSWVQPAAVDSERSPAADGR